MDRDITLGGSRTTSRVGSRPTSSLHMSASFVDPPPVEPRRSKQDLGDSDDSLDDDDMQRVLQASARRPAPVAAKVVSPKINKPVKAPQPLLSAKVPAPVMRAKPIVRAPPIKPAGSSPSHVTSARRSPPAAAATSFVAADHASDHDSSEDDQPSAEAFPPFANQMHNSMESHVKVADIDWGRFGEVHKLHDEINDLRSTVASKESELETVSEALLSLQDELKLLQSQDTHAVAKDFARRNKQLGFQLEKEKTRARALEEELHNLQQQLGAQAPPAAKKGKEKEEEGDEEDSAEALRQEAAELRNKYAMANKRMLDARAQVAQARQEVARLSKVLQRELGDEASVAEAMGDPGSDDKPRWVGRAQKIAVLSARLKEAKAQLSSQVSSSQKLPVGGPALLHLQQLDRLLAHGAAEAVMDDTDDSSELRGMLSQVLGALRPSLGLSLPNGQAPAPAQTNVGGTDRQRQALESMERDRRVEHDRLKAEHEAATREMSAMRQKQEALAARCRTLEADHKSMRSKMTMVLDKSDADDRLIDTLRNELETKRTQAARAQRAQSAAVATAEAVPELQRQTAAQSEQLENQRRIIIALRDELAKQRGRAVQAAQSQLDSTAAATAEHEVNMLRIELQKQRELTDIYRQRVDEAETRVSESNAARMLAESANLKLTRGQAAAAPAKPGKTKPATATFEPETAESLRLKLDTLTAQSSSRDNELRLCQEMLAQQRQMHRQAVGDLKMRIQELENSLHSMRGDD